MATIGTFTKASNGTFTGKIQTLSISAKVVMEATSGEASSEKSPTHRIKAGDTEIGAAWEKQTGEGRVYYSVKLDDPSFSEPVYATLTETKKPGEFALIWNRQGAVKYS